LWAEKREVNSREPKFDTRSAVAARKVHFEIGLLASGRLHHRELHRSGDEAAWWRKLDIDPVAVALRLWQQTQAGLTLHNQQALWSLKTLRPFQLKDED
jgi:hypothetical protein